MNYGRGDEAQTTPRVHAAAGVSVDSTMGFNRMIGFRAGTGFPWWCWDHSSGRSLPVLEVPMHLMDVALFSPSALEYNEEQAITHCLEIMERVQAAGGCLTLNWHPNFISDPVIWDTYTALLKEASRRTPSGATLKDIHAHRLQLEGTLTAGLS